LVERGEHHSRHKSEEDDDDLLVREVLGLVGTSFSNGLRSRFLNRTGVS
jgi:hypothetical protein